MRERPARFLPLSLALAAMLAGATASRGQEGPETPGAGPDGDGAGAPYVEIPGVGRIPMPPGVRVFGPRSAPAPAHRAGPSRPESQAGENHEDSRGAASLDRLFAKLAAAEDAREADAISAVILQGWARSGSDTIDLLVARAGAAEQGGGGPLVKDLLDFVVALAPDWPEGYVRRARAVAARGDPEAALPDFEKAARLDPRRFDALAELGAAAEAVGNKKRALEAYRKSLAVSPRQDAARKAEERLKLEVEGRDI